MFAMQAPTAAKAVITVFIVCGSPQAASASAISSALSSIEDYTTNAICSKKNCINPIFPGMEDLQRLQHSKWVSSSWQKASSFMSFCRNAVDYDPALPVPEQGNVSLKSMVKRQDSAAATMFYFHLAGLGLDAWDYQKPELANDCVKSTWRLVCYTYFPRAEVGKPDGALQEYLRPCQSSCGNYIRACGVECCDESVQCVFTHEKAISAMQIVVTQGYIAHDAPSSLCTGAASRSATPLQAWLWALIMLKALLSIDVSFASFSKISSRASRQLFLFIAVVSVALVLQGCGDVPIHKVGNWRAEPDYFLTQQFIPPGGKAAEHKTTNINSCNNPNMSPVLQCSGRGRCKRWDKTNFNNALAFCLCDRDWADAECRTKRKSQTVAYLLSLFFGMFGADQHYLGFHAKGVAKLLTLGGGGIWWIIDIIYIGSAPVATTSFETAADLPHSAFALITTTAAVLLGFIVAYVVTTKFRGRRRHEAMTVQLDEEGRDVKAWHEIPFADSYRSNVKGHPVIRQRAGGTMPPMGPMGFMPPMGPMAGMPPMHPMMP